jgi:hypothetical protein
MDKLTTQETARIFAMYLSADIKYQHELYSEDGSRMESTNTYTKKVSLFLPHYLMMEGKYHSDCKLLLSPLSKINDEDAIEVASFGFTDAVSNEEKCAIGKDFIQYYYLNGGLNEKRSVAARELEDYREMIFQYLISKGYAVPLFISPNHPCNGQDAISLGIAIDKTLNQ